jgi:sugar phosphate isomerase/epimerase
MADPPPIGLNTYCLRALRWNDRQLLDYAAAQKMDVLFLQDSLDPRAKDPAHWAEVKRWSEELGLTLETGGGGVFPMKPELFQASVDNILFHARRAAAMGSKIVRMVCFSQRSAMPPGPAMQHLETMVRLLKAVRPQLEDLGVRPAIEVHKDFHSWEFKLMIEEAGRDFAGIYLDTGNPVFVHEHPMTAVETLAPYVLTFHLRDSVVYEHPKGIAVQWVPLGEGNVDFPALLQRFHELCPRQVSVVIKPITGRLPAILPVHDPQYWQAYPQARASEFAKFLQLAKSGAPYETYMLIEDAPGRPPELLPLVQAQQKEHLERSIAYGKTKLGLGRRWRP